MFSKLSRVVIASCIAVTGCLSGSSDSLREIELNDLFGDDEEASVIDPADYLNPCGIVQDWDNVETRVLLDGEDDFPLCTRNIICRENKDTPVAFDVTVVRDADQGFFDISVRFQDIFCSAKFDTCTIDDVGKESPLNLLYNADGQPSPTVVLGLACSASPGEDINTVLHMSSIVIDCPPPFEDIHLDPSAQRRIRDARRQLQEAPTPITEHLQQFLNLAEPLGTRRDPRQCCGQELPHRPL